MFEALERGAEPHTVDNRLVASLPPSVGSALQQQTRFWNDPQYGYDFEITGYSIRGQVALPDLELAREMIVWCLQPASEPVVKAALAELRVSTKSRAEVDDDLALGLQVYADEMSRFPADVVVAAVRKLSRREKFYPSRSELRDELNRESKRRRALAAAVKEAISVSKSRKALLG